MMTPITKTTVFILCALLMTGCANLLNFQQPTVDLVGIKALPNTNQGPRFQIDLRIVNPNSTPLTINGVYYELALRDTRFLSGTTNQTHTIPAYGENTVQVETAISMFQVLKLMSKFVAQPDNQALDYALTAKIDVKELFVPLTVTQAGKIDGDFLKNAGR